MNKDSLLIYTSYMDKFKKLTDAQFGKLIKVMLKYQEDGKEPIIDDPYISFAFDMVKVDIDTNNKKYEEACEKRKQAGAKGGLAKASKAKQKLASISKASNTKQGLAFLHDNDNDNDNEHDNDIKNNNSAQVRSGDVRLDSAITRFKEHRKKLRKPMTDYAVELFKNRLNKITPNIEEQLELINTAIERGWQTVYPADKPPESTIKNPKNNDKLKALESFYINGGDG